jgi:hypothetical protein
MANSQSILEILLQIKANVDQVPKVNAQLAGIVSQANKANASLARVAENTNGAMTKALRGVTGVGRQLLDTFGVVYTVGGALKFLKNSLDQFAESERALAKLSGTVTAAGGNFALMKPALDDAAQSLMKYGFHNDDVVSGLAAFINRGFTVRESLDAIKVAAKLATLEGIPLSEAIQAIAVASQGVIRPGSLLGQLLGSVTAQLKEGADQSTNLRLMLAQLGRLDPAVEAQLDTLSLKTKTASSAWQDFSENVGAFISKHTALPQVLQGIANDLRQVNEQMERNRRIAEGAGTPTDRLDALREEISLLAKVDVRIDQNRIGQPYRYRQKFDNSEITALQKSLNQSEAEIIVMLGGKTAPDYLVARLRQLRLQMTAERKNETAAASQAQAAVEKQQTDQAVRAQQDRQKRVTELLKTNAAADALKKANATLAEQQAANEFLYAQDPTKLQQYLARRYQIEFAGLTKEAALLRAQQTENQSKLAAGNLTADAQAKLLDDQRALATRLIEIGAESGKLRLAIYADGLEKQKKLDANAAAVELALAETQTNELLKAQIELQTKLKELKAQGATAAQLAAYRAAAADKLAADSALAAAQKIDASLEQRLSNINTQVNTGSLSRQGGLRSALVARADASTAKQTQLDGLERAGGGGPLQSQAAKAAAQLRMEIAALQPTLEELAATSDTVTAGMAHGFKNITDSIGTLSQGIATTFTDIFNSAMATARSSIDGLLAGTKNLGQAWRDFGRAAVTSIIMMVGQYIAGKIAMMAVDKVFAVQTAASNATTLASGAAAGVGQAGAQGGIWGVLLYAIVFAAVMAGVMAMVAGVTGGFASGGRVDGDGGPTDDKIPAMLSNGEYVISAKGVRAAGYGLLDALNAGLVNAADLAGALPAAAIPRPQFAYAMGGPVTSHQSPITRRSRPAPTVVVIGNHEAQKLGAMAAMRNAVKASLRDGRFVQSALERRRGHQL